MASSREVTIRYRKTCTCTPASVDPEMWQVEDTEDGFTLTVTMPPVVYCSICEARWEAEVIDGE